MLLALLACASAMIVPQAFAQNADMTEEQLSRMTGVDPLWVHITPCLASSVFESTLAKERADGVTPDQLRKQLADQLASNPKLETYLADFYSVDEKAIADDIRQKHDNCVANITGAPLGQVDACYERLYAPYLQTLFGSHPQAADPRGTRIAYTACLKKALGQ
ncbi:hypothetical protein C0Z18_24420 [Trinickia dabaoshanensis]|uniref:Uncharacterized protein n=2 Tax=Trinickia dabaoshanensis TaxID=564714 RepID=A0A2N7VG57_9BURK|nr:hypothetical protein C0Z18_24420 [Trinickia dabaoshanensis]